MPSFDACENCGRDIQAHDSGMSELVEFMSDVYPYNTQMVCEHCHEKLEARQEAKATLDS